MFTLTLVKPNIQVFRAKFSEITPNSIRRACETLVEPDANVSDAVDVRQELDLRIGNVALMHVKITFFRIIGWLNREQFILNNNIAILCLNKFCYMKL